MICSDICNCDFSSRSHGFEGLYSDGAGLQKNKNQLQTHFGYHFQIHSEILVL